MAAREGFNSFIEEPGKTLTRKESLKRLKFMVEKYRGEADLNELRQGYTYSE